MAPPSVFSAPNDRIQVVDALRGFALLGIVFVHMLEQFLAAKPPPELFATVQQTVLDGWIGGFSDFALRGKFFSLFSLLFGMSFYIQLRSAEQKGVNFQQRFLWRLCILLLIGYLHALFYRGDILMVYALLGVPLLYMRAWPRWLIGLMLLLIFSGAVRALVFWLFQGEPFTVWGSWDYHSAENQDYFRRLSSGSLLDVMALNASYSHLARAEFQFNIIGRGYLTLGYFLLGMLVAQSGILRQFQHHKKPTWLLLAAAVLLTVLFIYTAIQFFQQTGDNGIASWPGVIALSIWSLADLMMLTAYICLFLLLFQTVAGYKLLNLLSPYGRMALTAYVSQTLIGTFIFYHYGLGLLGKVSNSTAAMLATGIVLVQIALSHVWLKYYYYGPLEWLWRCGTLKRWVVNRRSASQLNINKLA